MKFRNVAVTIVMLTSIFAANYGQLRTPSRLSESASLALLGTGFLLFSRWHRRRQPPVPAA